jgi:hypothetical protein
MADIEISQFPTVVGALTGNEFIPVLQGGVNKKASLNQIQAVTFGFGTMAAQDSDSVSITGGSISGSTVTGTVAVINGGTGLTDVPTNGQVLIGNGVDFDLNTLTAGSGVTITNGAGVITIEAAGSGGTVTSVGGTGTVNGITLTGSVTTTGSLTLGGTLSGVSLATQVTGTLPVANGGTALTTAPTDGQLLIGNGTGYALATITAGAGVSVTNGPGTITVAASAGSREFGARYAEITNSEVIIGYLNLEQLTYAANLSDWGVLVTGTAPTGDMVFDVQDDGVSIGTITIAATTAAVTKVTSGGTAKVVAALSQTTVVAPADAETVGVGTVVTITAKGTL